VRTSSQNLRRRRLHTARDGFTLLEISIVVAIIGLLAAIATPAFLKARQRSRCELCKNNQRLIFDAINLYSMENPVALIPSQWPNLCAARNRLAPGRQELYLKDWTIFDCPVADSQTQHDYAYVWKDGIMVGIRCNNSDPAIRSLHNE